MGGRISQTLSIFFTGFIPIRGRPSISENRFSVRIYVTELIFETYFKARVFAFEFLLCHRANTFLHICLHGCRDFFTTRIRIEHPLLWVHSVPAFFQEPKFSLNKLSNNPSTCLPASDIIPEGDILPRRPSTHSVSIFYCTSNEMFSIIIL